MPTQLRISQRAQDLLRCPVCHRGLTLAADQFECSGPDCSTRFPVIDGIPVLINERSSVFSIDDFVSRRKTYFSDTGAKSLKKTIQALLPDNDLNLKGAANYARLRELMMSQSPAPRVLVLGGSILGDGMESITGEAAIDLVESDISFGPRTGLICDAHDICFEDKSFDGVIVQAVLEHVVDPHRCCQEIHRVLKDDGIVYAETPFIQQVHGGRYDFTRFTLLGHRRLFRQFEEIDSGATGGPGMALAWSYQYFLLSFATSRLARKLLRLFAKLTSFYLKYFDYHLIDKPGALDAASGCYFLGRKSEKLLSDRELIRQYRGADG